MPREFPQVDLKYTEQKAASTKNQDERVLFFSKLEQLVLVFLEKYTTSAKENYESATWCLSLLNLILLFYKYFLRLMKTEYKYICLTYLDFPLHKTQVCRGILSCKYFRSIHLLGVKAWIHRSIWMLRCLRHHSAITYPYTCQFSPNCLVFQIKQELICKGCVPQG